MQGQRVDLLCLRLTTERANENDGGDGESAEGHENLPSWRCKENPSLNRSTESRVQQRATGVRRDRHEPASCSSRNAAVSSGI